MPPLGVEGQLSLPSLIPSPSSSLSQASPRLSLSASDWLALATSGQLSSSSMTPSPSLSGSQASPMPSPSTSDWPELSTPSQLSSLSHSPSPSPSFCTSTGQLSRQSTALSASVSRKSS